ncbi:DUF159 family protein [Planctomycetota bacterium]|nr:DUF159 family protein [Planctomycetota bacterium]
MCGRFANSETIPVMRATFASEGNEVPWSPSWNITPTRQIPVLIQDQRSRRLGLMRWGWNPDALGGRLLVNCRGDEAHAKRMFQAPLENRRCLIPATAFYEWRPAAQAKAKPTPFAFAPRAGGLFAIAGLWLPRIDADGTRSGAVILMTVPANDVVAPVHDRMPLVIGREQAAAWLTDPEAARDLIITPPAEAWMSWRIGQAIGDVRRDGPEIAADVGE